jgi:hypothetical protein
MPSSLIPSRRQVLIGGGVVAGTALAGGLGYDWWAASTYSHGWRMGLLFKLSEKSTWRRLYIRSTGEGDLMLGAGSSRAEWAGADGQTQTNPWSFSATRDQAEQYQGLEGRMVAVEYRQIMHRYHAWQGDTDYRVVQIVPVDPKLGVEEGFSIAGRGGLRSAGRRVGRLVKVTRKGIAAKSWEVTLQEGAGGNNFLEMSILHDDMFEAAETYLRSGRLLSIAYAESVVRNPIARDTNYEVIGIKPIQDPAAG